MLIAFRNGRPLDLNRYPLQPSSGDQPAPLPVPGEDLVESDPEASPVDGELDVKLGRLALKAPDDRVHAVPVALILAVG